MALQNIPIQEDPGGATLLEDGTGDDLLYAIVTVVYSAVYRERAYPVTFRED